MVECQIWQDDDHVKTWSSPCTCSGSLKYAHRACVQHWCNKKGDITYEICHEVSCSYACSLNISIIVVFVSLLSR
ncbi:hypothetical protein BHE74_00014968 [Ensete ventricosum]|uniref:Uncharacterized protein n=1 Tax=Ensete ventricosum TaxID=4639 RepID=A0A444FKZ2_ENSVE|nr:hypothetical protein B296_00021442 [Ensete ventricosum]RWW23303.1 hypothetical protein GW17_00012452 [Ensete ventricosum]RWW76909.1 hypothetical protein BHE74_00014968 [Ensete ventricosum]RZR91685.1 hypothetical protein BHM03_00019867 [Ensete ventricosum]